MATAKPTFEEQLAQLQQIVNHLEQGNVPLEEALQQFQEGIKLSKELQTKLTNAEKTLGHLIDDNGDEKVYESKPMTQATMAVVTVDLVALMNNKQRSRKR